MGVEGLEALEHRDRDQEVAPRVTDKAFDLAFVIAFAGPTEPVFEKIMRLKLAEHARALSFAVSEDTGHCDLRVVIQNRLRDPAKEGKCPNVPVAECFRRLRRIRHHKTRVRVRQVECQEMDLALHPADDPDGFAKSTRACPGGCASGTNISCER